MRSSISFLVFFAIVFALVVSPVYSLSGIIKICVIGDIDDDPDWSSAIDSIALFIAKNHTKAPQIYKHKDHKGSACDFIGSVDRAKMRADFILIVKKNHTEPINCEAEWGRESFAIMRFGHTPTHWNVSDCAHEDNKFRSEIIFSSTEEPIDNDRNTSWIKVHSGQKLLSYLWPRFLHPTSRIPDEYSFKAEREERIKRRTLKAVIAMMSLVVCSLLVIMFMGSLTRYKESQVKKEQDAKKPKKTDDEQQQLLGTPSSKEKASSKEKTDKPPVMSKETVVEEKSEKTEKSEKKLGSAESATSKKEQ